ncbi:hypothetical protein CERSUDRAFT_117526 [Gelatoporia subvermispora B]|uniref:Uncharacterized protein n=1 Tax=Ceriporiopsis subvermispora (strain B) TaxID=914234 RepID=M2QAN9_CERS8|nr:hypothetical protein CERSUDRAFT_117526 [Gelatoporia subvermispora B]
MSMSGEHGVEGVDRNRARDACARLGVRRSRWTRGTTRRNNAEDTRDVALCCVLAGLTSSPQGGLARARARSRRSIQSPPSRRERLQDKHGEPLSHCGCDCARRIHSPDAVPLAVISDCAVAIPRSLAVAVQSPRGAVQLHGVHIQARESASRAGRSLGIDAHSRDMMFRGPASGGWGRGGSQGRAQSRAVRGVVVGGGGGGGGLQQEQQQESLMLPATVAGWAAPTAAYNGSSSLLLQRSSWRSTRFTPRTRALTSPVPAAERSVWRLRDRRPHSGRGFFAVPRAEGRSAAGPQRRAHRLARLMESDRRRSAAAAAAAATTTATTKQAHRAPRHTQMRQSRPRSAD